MLQDTNSLRVITHENVDATQGAIAMGIIRCKGDGLAKLARGFPISGLVRIEISQPTVPRPIVGTDLDGELVRFFCFCQPTQMLIDRG